MARPSRKKTWQTGRERVSVNAALAIQRENVMQRLVRLRTDVGHPEKQGEPLPQDQAAVKAGVTVRQWQRWESGASVPYARNLSAVADAFGFDVGEFYDGPAGQQPVLTPSPFADQDERTAAMEKRLMEQADIIRGLLEQQNGLLSRQSSILERIEKVQAGEEAAVERLKTATQRADEAAHKLDASVAAVGRALRGGIPRRGPAAKKPAPKRSPRASKPKPD